ncbi:putative brevis radix (BRX) domain, protein BREVIS RADIX [Helianthus annuus]|nr:putative brevis radix (BRX) domain, protein BREVIS RADIX [Helianthus annuus]KAJ0737999.1 putative brevis radix (BRX) domain, protein BREVIS RADIX [Helianthus annuus]
MAIKTTIRIHRLQNFTYQTVQLLTEFVLQIKDMAIKCNPCNGAAMTTPQQQLQKRNGDVESERFRWSYRRSGSKNSSSGRVWGKEMEARLKGISMGGGDVLCTSASGRRQVPVVLEEEKEPKEWVAQVEPGVLITFVSLPRGGNDLKRIRFSYNLLLVHFYSILFTPFYL